MSSLAAEPCSPAQASEIGAELQFDDIDETSGR
jgi:hypothetical protein